jgi:predicted nucleic acid-binding protein
VGFLDEIQGQIVGLDTTPLICFIEWHSVYHPVLRPVFAALAEGYFLAVTSTVTLLETLVLPLRNKRLDLAHEYEQILLHARHLTSYNLSPAIAVRAAEIRADYQFRTPDAIQLATAVYAEATFFLTNDRALQRFSELNVVLLDDLP